jgi:hypothetical protein
MPTSTSRVPVPGLWSELHTAEDGSVRQLKTNSRDQSTDNLHRYFTICDSFQSDSSRLDNGERMCETERFPRGKKTFQMVHGAWRDSMTALFKILWRMKHTV